MKKYFIYFILIIIIFYITFFDEQYIYIIKKNNYIKKMNIKNDLYRYIGNLEKPVTYIQGSVHGNEPSGSNTCLQLLKDDFKVSKGTVVIFPFPNVFGYKMNLRRQFDFYPDINRNFLNNGKCFISRKIIDIVKNSDFIVDLHEGWGYYRMNYKSIGSSLSTTTKFSNDLSHNIVNNLNKIIKEKNKNFSVNDRFTECRIKGSLRCFLNKLNKNYILVETTGQNNIQPLNIRVNQMKFIVKEVINKINN